MRLLIITQKVDSNDPVLGFFHRWIEEFSKHCEQITVICLYEGVYNLPDNVRVFSLGKEHSVSRLSYILSFYHLIWRERRNYDAVFVHMNPIYVIFGGLLWKITKKKIGLWYTHKNVDTKLQIAEKLVDIIFTASRESFRFQSTKVLVVGHGVPFELFKREVPSVFHEKIQIISVGRITPIKNLDILIDTVGILKNRNFNVGISIVGAPVCKDDEDYSEKLRKEISEKGLGDNIVFVGTIPNNKIREYYWKSDLSINLCPTGGVDKAVLESIAAGLIVLVSNEAFSEYFGKYSEYLIFKERNAMDLARKITELVSREDKEKMKRYIYERTIERANLDQLILRVLRIYETSQ